MRKVYLFTAAAAFILGASRSVGRLDHVRPR
jgi:hypothetical protein